MCLAARKAIVKLLCNEVPAGVSGTLNFTSSKAQYFYHHRKGEQMKTKKHKKALGVFGLFLIYFGVLFAGFCLCNAIAVVIDCIFDGFDSFWESIMNLPFLLYLCLSLVISAVLAIALHPKTR